MASGYAIDGARATRYAYDSTGKVIRSGFENGEATDSFTYTSDTSIPSNYKYTTTLTDVRSQATVYKFETVKGARVRTSTVTSGTAITPSGTSSLSYSNDGFISQSIDANGSKTIYAYNRDGLLLSSTVAVGTASALTTTYTYVQADSNHAADLTRITRTGADGARINAQTTVITGHTFSTR